MKRSCFAWKFVAMMMCWGRSEGERCKRLHLLDVLLDVLGELVDLRVEQRDLLPLRERVV